jgi:hypothetical protein
MAAEARRNADKFNELTQLRLLFTTTDSGDCAQPQAPGLHARCATVRHLTLNTEASVAQGERGGPATPIGVRATARAGGTTTYDRTSPNEDYEPVLYITSNCDVGFAPRLAPVSRSHSQLGQCDLKNANDRRAQLLNLARARQLT